MLCQLLYNSLCSVPGFIKILPYYHYLYIAISFFTVSMISLVVFMLVYIVVKNRIKKKIVKRRHIAFLLIQRAIFFEDDTEFSASDFYRGLKLVQNVHFRK